MTIAGPGRLRRVRRRSFYWLVPAAFVAHCAEELPRFPRWATRHFGTTTTQFYIASHCVLVPIVAASANAGVRSGDDQRGAFFATSVASCLLANAGFHLVMSRRFREYSPGLITGFACVAPSASYVLCRARADELISDRRLVAAVLAGGLLNGAVVLSLRLDMPRLARLPTGS